MRDYIARFNKEKLEVEDFEESIAMTALIGGLQKGKLLWKLIEDPPKSMVELLAIAGKVMNAEEVMDTKYSDEKGSSSGGKFQKKNKDGKKRSAGDKFAY